MRAWILTGLAAASLAAATATAAPEDGPLPNGGRPVQRTAFPKITHWSSLRIRLERTACFGTCPIYSVELTGDGGVTYRGVRFTAVVGERRAHVDPMAVRRLFDAFARADFFWTFDDYRAPMTDQPTYIVTLAYDGHEKTVRDYAGQAVGMPAAIGRLEEAIDQAADTTRWIKDGGR